MRLFHIGRPLPERETWSSRPDWQQASPALIERAVRRAMGRPTGGWYVVGASRRFGSSPSKHVIADHDLVGFRDAHGRPHLAPLACPHMGADLSCGRTTDGRIVCPWHGLALGTEGHGAWQPFPTHDDGVLIWVRLDEPEQAPTERPILAPRPERYLDAVVRIDATCEPEDVIANRLDPWHGVHYHPHSFTRLRILDADDDVLTLRVSYKVAGPVCVEVDATFHSPEPRTITMTIVGGEGIGSVVETHATPTSAGTTAIIEATLAASDRRGFALARAASRLVRPFVERRAARLWVEDAAYAERRHTVRTAAGKKSRARLRSVG